MEHMQGCVCVTYLRRSQSTCLQYVNIDFVIVLFYIPYIVILGREIWATNM